MKREFYQFVDSTGKTIKFAHLTIYDVFGDPTRPDRNGFVPLFRYRQKLEMLENLRLAETDKDQIAFELSEFDREEVNVDTFISFLRSPLGWHQVLTFSWEKAGNKDELPILTPAEWSTVREAIVGPVGVVFEAPQEEPPGAPPIEGPIPAPRIKGVDDIRTFGDGAEDPNPETPPTFEMTAGATDSATGTTNAA